MFFLNLGRFGPPGPRDPYLRVGGIGGKRSPIVPSKSVVIGPILGQKTVWPMYALVYPALLSGSWPEPKIFQNFDLAQTHQNIPWAGIGDSVEAIVTQQLQEPLRLQLDLILEKLAKFEKFCFFRT